jgi:hypothetical protein
MQVSGVRGRRARRAAKGADTAPAVADIHQHEAPRFGHSGGMSDLETIIQKLVRQELQEQMPGIIARALDEDRKARGDVARDAVESRALLSVHEAAVAAARHPVTLRKALERGELHGHQLKKGGRWALERQCLLAWLAGEPCAHKQNVTPLRPSRPRQ